MIYGLHKMTWGAYFDPNALGGFFEDAARAGAKTIEFRPPDACLAFDAAEIRRVRQLARANGLGMNFCFVYPEGVDMRSPDPEIRRQATEHLKKGIRVCRELEGRELGGVLYLNWPAVYQGDMITKEVRRERRLRCLECLTEAMKTAEELDVPVNLEVINRYEDYTINTVSEGLAFIGEIASPKCNLLLDVFHMNIEEEDIPAAIRSAAGHIGHFHVSEPNRGIPHHTARVNWPAIGEALRSTGYDGSVTIEAVVSFDGPSTYNMRLWRDLAQDSSREERVEAMRRGLEYIRSQFEPQA